MRLLAAQIGVDDGVEGTWSPILYLNFLKSGLLPAHPPRCLFPVRMDLNVCWGPCYLLWTHHLGF